MFFQHLPGGAQASWGFANLSIRRLSMVAGLAWGLVLVAGCSTPNPTPLPDLSQPGNDRLLKPAQKQKAIEDMALKKAQEQADAVKQIERQR